MGRKKKSITQKNLEVLSVRVNYDVYQRVEELAHRRDLNMTQIMREAIRDYLNRHLPPPVPGREAA